ncbi:MAG TPA: hypothetical protein VIG48_01395 [Jatrophihabitans sp.]|jgi:hypothetical protein
MSAIKQVSKALGATAVAAVVVGLGSGFGSAANASPVPPVASTALAGTWVNTDAATRSVKQIVITGQRGGTIKVDAFGACTPSLCEWGSVPGIVYGPNVSSTTGTTFQTNQRFLSGSTEWSRIALQGTVKKTAAGLRLTVRESTVFEDNSGRKNYTRVEKFKLGKGVSPTKAGNPVSTYPLGDRPLLVAGALGSWTDVAPTGGLVKLVIGGSQASPTIEAFGQCSPTPCDWGAVRSVTYGSTISSSTGAVVLAPYSFGFKHAQIVVQYGVNAAGEAQLTVKTYNEFTDGSGRSNYVSTGVFRRS